MTNSYRCAQPWTSERPETLVVCCSDGRFHAQVEEFVRHEVSERPDLLALPGGPAVVDPWTSSFDEARVFDQAMRLFAEAHDLHAVWLIAHDGCAYYKLKHPQSSPAELRALQERDLHGARAAILLRHPGYEVRCVFAAREREVVVFETLATAGGLR